MASPFRAFRKYQKTLLAVAGVALMFVFVLGDPLSQYLRSHSGGTGDAGQHPSDIAVRWNGGKLTNTELGQLVIQRRVVNGFLRQVEAVGRGAAIDAGSEPQPLRVEMIVGPERPQDGVERDVVRMRIFADAARAAGMAISDDHLVRYLEELGRGLVPVDQIRAILSNFQIGGRRASTDYVLDALREEMLARNYMASYIFAFDTNLPEERWRDWLNVNDRVVVEAAAIPAESLLVDVPEPTEAELTAFFADYQDAEPRPDFQWGIELPSPTPAFAVPQKVAVQFLRADFEQFLTKVEDQITDDEIEKYYEDNKDPYFIRAESVLSESGESSADSASKSEDANESKDANEAAGEESSGSKAAPATNDESSRLRANPFRLTAFAEDAPAGGEPESSGDDQAAAEPQAAEPSEEPAAETPTVELEEPTEEPKQFQPLDEVRDEIRRQLAQLKVSEQLEELMTSLESQLDESYTEYFGTALAAEAEDKSPPLPPAVLADLTPLAKEHGLEYQKTELISALQLRELPIGMSAQPDEGNVPFYASIFSRDVELYQPISTYDLDNNRYLAMKTGDAPRKVPTLDEIRDQVVRAWKLRKAGELALKRAEELAKKAQTTGASLEDAFVDDKTLSVIKTDPFAYLTVGSVSRDTQQVQSFRLSEPEGIVAAGPEFMEKVFSLKEGKVGAAPNHDHSIAYVVRIAEHQDTPAELRQEFLSEADTWYGVSAMARVRAQLAVRVVLADMLESAGVQWEREADQIFRDEAESDES